MLSSAAQRRQTTGALAPQQLKSKARLAPLAAAVAAPARTAQMDPSTAAPLANGHANGHANGNGFAGAKHIRDAQSDLVAR